ncbi:UDP-glucose 4-epimerase GalE [Lawsonella clevelandensis]|uniref:UDP-glucose 4-epimerase GalE n=1 Tax=Lawsonella clevelandensis TaxID=1528099 RepID=UPI0032D92E1D
MKLLVTGGAGYVGSCVATVLVERGHDVTIVDNLSTGTREAVPAGTRFLEGDIKDVAHEVLSAESYDGVLHFAARSLVGESCEVPDQYWQGNVVTTLALLDAIRDNGVPRLVFSSTAATYGEPDEVPITEDMPTHPTNPYGATKLSMDMAITSYCNAYGLTATSLRYFNVAGAYRGAGENRKVETHIVPLVLEVAMGYREKIYIFGDDWPTSDGTCIRDYIHVLDLADAHILALEKSPEGRHSIFNLGSGEGFSVKEVVEACRQVTGHPIPAEVAERRAGDPAVLVASSEKAKQELGWNPQHTDITEIVSDAWEFTRQLGDRAFAAHKAH